MTRSLHTNSCGGLKKGLTLFLATLFVLPGLLQANKFTVGISDLFLFYEFNKEKQMDQPKNKEKFNLSQGSWYFMKDTLSFEFHPKFSGFNYTRATNSYDSVLFYMNTPNRVLHFPTAMGKRNFAYIAPSMMVDDQNGQGPNYEIIHMAQEDPHSLTRKLNAFYSKMFAGFSDEMIKGIVNDWKMVNVHKSRTTKTITTGWVCS